jgi:hypothetical protein
MPISPQPPKSGPPLTPTSDGFMYAQGNIKNLNSRFNIPGPNALGSELLNHEGLVARAFGVPLKQKLFNPPQVAYLEEQARKQETDTFWVDTPLFSSGRETFVFDEVTFEQMSTIKYRDGTSYKSEALSMLTCIIDITQTKNIIATPIQGRNGTIKEYISDGDYFVTIKGVVCSGMNNVRPDKKMKVLSELSLYPQAITVTSNILNDEWNIRNLVIQNFTIQQLEGDRSCVAVEIHCISDTVSMI